MDNIPTDASFLDEWSFDQFQSLVNRSNEDPKLKELLIQDNVVIFLHLLGCDSNGHAHRPFSPIYLNNVKVVDHIAERVYNLLEDYFKDNRTAYIFTADHGMSDKGSNFPLLLTECLVFVQFIKLIASKKFRNICNHVFHCNCAEYLSILCYCYPKSRMHISGDQLTSTCT